MLCSNCFAISGAQSKRSPSTVSMLRKLPLHAQFACDCVPFRHSTILLMNIQMYSIELGYATVRLQWKSHHSIRSLNFMKSISIEFPIKFNSINFARGLVAAKVTNTTVRRTHWIEWNKLHSISSSLCRIHRVSICVTKRPKLVPQFALTIGVCLLVAGIATMAPRHSDIE